MIGYVLSIAVQYQQIAGGKGRFKQYHSVTGAQCRAAKLGGTQARQDKKGACDYSVSVMYVIAIVWAAVA